MVEISVFRMLMVLKKGLIRISDQHYEKMLLVVKTKERTAEEFTADS
jgi:hypothetical protein